MKMTQEWNDHIIGPEAGLSPFSEGSGKTMWKCEQLRAGNVYAKFMFNTKEQAESFASEMTRVQPDIFFRIEPVETSAIWN
ncbi:MAG TPA: hypothetical protein VHX11_05045 [Acidobacteriaceae bacterium]|jgi:hypothetical protein|nr:hypothetical protein [Acidobacteriaceae bacterium]